MAAQNALIPSHATEYHHRRDSTRLFSIKEVSEACGLPGPVVMLVPRTWVEPLGWLYTLDQISAAVTISESLHRPSGAEPPEAQREPIEMLSCERCAVLTTIADARVRGWLNVVQPDTRGPEAWDGKDYCAQCVTRCANCRTEDSDRLCETCFGMRRVPRPPLFNEFCAVKPTAAVLPLMHGTSAEH